MAVTVTNSSVVTVAAPGTGSVTVSQPLYSVEAKQGWAERGDAYPGEYEIEPSETAQILPTENCLLRGNVTVAPIPDNYGRIAWDGTMLRVY